ncbi:hypothetical protein [Nocardioides sp.]|uniref:hypothetical protein n=1 Tax=Nocardioides sp. TaxID=35761 RepID=UPI0027209419|nr:hypothetical protein [Nocardioides sp.]MDO9455860.1 hypothetical protein [Nocardioides sp.]
MGTNMQGMDTEEARSTANQMDSHAAVVGDVCAKLLARVQGTSWIGQDKDRISDDIGNQFIPNANAACEDIKQQASYLIAKADEQDSISS